MDDEQPELQVAPQAPPEERVGRKLRRLRAAEGLSQEQLARLMVERGHAWRQNTVSTVEGASRPLRVNELVDLADIFDTTLDDLAAFEIPVKVFAKWIPEAEEWLQKLNAEIVQVEEDLQKADLEFAAITSKKARLEMQLRDLRRDREGLVLQIDHMKSDLQEGMADGQPREEA